MLTMEGANDYAACRVLCPDGANMNAVCKVLCPVGANMNAACKVIYPDGANRSANCNALCPIGAEDSASCNVICPGIYLVHFNRLRLFLTLSGQRIKMFGTFFPVPSIYPIFAELDRVMNYEL